MARLNKDAYQAIVVGTGFGGAVAACRLAQAGVDVAVLERGLRYPLGGFPRHPVRHDLMSWHHGGPYDVRAMNDVLVVQGAGYGGGSLIYAKVQMRPLPEAFDDGWPAGYSRGTLDPYYDLVAYMLDITPVQDDPETGEPPPKTRLMRLSTYEHFADRDALSRVVLERMLAGVSTRRFPRTQGAGASRSRPRPARPRSRRSRTSSSRARARTSRRS